MRKVTFDIETSNLFSDVGSNDPAKLALSVVCVHDSETDSYSSYLEEDLGKLWPILEKTDMLIGYNSDHFDIPLLNKYYPGDLSKIKSVDLLKEIRASLGRRIKLDDIAEATLGKNKTAHGLEAVVWWRNGEKDKVVKYCLEDVKITKELYEYALKNKHVKYREGTVVKDIKLDPSNWEKTTETAMTHTLPF
ncbi:MAG: DEAD/DEAH box helicase domain protein [Parcubacteria group bacterium GW2011_GWA2_47_16]|nr:MAG: DEAD/DEAH box helicase domain protein [Parcubacteria group bacterium GW2011_GWA2_47_16]